MVTGIIPETLSIPAGNSTYSFIGAARSTHVSADPLADALAAHAAATVSPATLAVLLPSHEAQWLTTWQQSVIEYLLQATIKPSFSCAPVLGSMCGSMFVSLSAWGPGTKATAWSSTPSTRRFTSSCLDMMRPSAQDFPSAWRASLKELSATGEAVSTPSSPMTPN